MSILNVGEVQTNLIKSTTGNTALTINSSGIVTKPNNPAFEAIRTSGDVGVQYAANQEIVFNSVNLNIGNNYNTLTGRFTAPISGTYVFKMFGMTLSVTSYIIRKNSVALTYISNSYASSTGTFWAHASTTSVMYLNAGDYASVWIPPWGSGMYAAGNNHNIFCGYLLN